MLFTKRTFAVMALALAMVLMLGACEMRVGWVSSRRSAKMTASFLNFSATETKSVNFKQGETVELDYQVKLSKGTIGISIVGPDGNVIVEDKFDEDTQGSLKVSITKDGQYEIIIVGEGARGSYRVEWH